MPLYSAAAVRMAGKLHSAMLFSRRSPTPKSLLSPSVWNDRKQQLTRLEGTAVPEHMFLYLREGWTSEPCLKPKAQTSSRVSKPCLDTWSRNRTRNHTGALGNCGKTLAGGSVQLFPFGIPRAALRQSTEGGLEPHSLKTRTRPD